MTDASFKSAVAAQGWEWCPGEGEQGERVDANWSRCPSCRWVGFRSKVPVVIPQHQRAKIEQDTLF